MKVFDVAVLGLGAMGSASALALTKRGNSVIGIEQFSPAHDRGSSHGETRLIRKAYFEHPSYVPLLKTAYELWDEIERQSRQGLFERVGVLLAGAPTSEVVMGTKKSACEHGLPLQVLTANEANGRFPAFRFPEEFEVLFEEDAGFLWVERAIEAMLELSRNAGAEFRWMTRVLDVKRDSSENFVIRTSVQDGISETLHAKKLVVTTGPWTSAVLKDLGLPLVVQRMPVGFYRSTDATKASKGMPGFGIDTGYGFIYGFPQTARGMKIADHSFREVVQDVEKLVRTTNESDFTNVYRAIDAFIPAARKDRLSSSVCMYTMSPDEHFILDLHPRDPRIAIAAGFSGHGFKFAPVVGEIMTDLIVSGKTKLPADFLKIRWKL